MKIEPFDAFESKCITPPFIYVQMSDDENEKLNVNNHMPLVKLKVENITYKRALPTTRASLNQSIRKKNDDASDANETIAEKVILNNVSTPAIEPYKLQGWMGPSGSGKTSLLSIVAGMIDYDPEYFSDESYIGINDDPRNILTNKSSRVRGLSGIVWQDDLLLSNLTVRETIEFAARLKTPKQGLDNIDALVDDVLKDLGLTEVQHSLIGNQTGGKGRGISGGERKRVSVAQELVTRPPLIFLDEPTSGLDSSAALDLMKTLQKLCKKGGHSIVTVIHQPRTTIFELFDDLLLLSKGEEIFSGRAHMARNVLESCPIIGTPLPEQTNIADWILDLIIVDEKRILLPSSNTGDEEEHTSAGRCLPTHWQKWKKDREKELSEHVRVVKNKFLRLSTLEELKNSMPKYAAPFLVQLQLLTRRAVTQTKGEKISRVTIIASCCYILFESIMWFRLTNDTNHIYQRNSLIFFLIIAQANGVVISSVPVFKGFEMALLKRERAKKMYRVFPYFLAKTTADVTTTILLPLLHTMIVFFLTNMRLTEHGGSFFMFSFLFYLTLTAAQSFGLLMSVALPTLQFALVITPALTIFLFIVGGFYIPFANMPAWIGWLRWFSFATYGYCGLLVNEWSGNDIPCAESVSLQIGPQNLCPLPGDEVLQSLGITGVLSSIWFNIVMLIVIQVLCRGTAYKLLRNSR